MYKSIIVTHEKITEKHLNNKCYILIIIFSKIYTP